MGADMMTERVIKEINREKQLLAEPEPINVDLQRTSTHTWPPWTRMDPPTSNQTNQQNPQQHTQDSHTKHSKPRPTTKHHKKPPQKPHHHQKRRRQHLHHQKPASR